MNNLFKRIFGLLTASVIAFEVPNIEAVKIFAQSEPTGYTAEGLPEVYLPKDMEGNDKEAYILPEMEKYIGDNVFNEEKDVNSEADLKAETDEEALSLSDAEDSDVELFASISSIVNAGNAAVSTSGSYTWSATTVNGMTVAKPGNSGVNSSTSTMTVKTSGGSGVLAFACYVSSESNYDKLIVKRDGTTIHTLSGVKDWQKLTVDVSSSTSTITFEYSKDSSTHSNEDICYIADVSYCRNVSSSDFNFNSSTGEITKYVGSGGAIVIPSTIGGVAVKGIGYEAFYNCTGLTGVTIPSSVTSIGSFAFFYCTGLTSVSIPDSVTYIGFQAFYKCTGLTSVSIPNSITTINDSTFGGCTGLTGVVIPSSVNTIGDSVFEGCISLRSVTIPGSLTSIGTEIFGNCTGLRSVTILSGVTTTGMYTFSGCTGLTSVTIPSSVTTIGDNAFENCKSLTSVTIPGSVTSIGGSAFYGCTGLTSMTIPNRVTSIGSSAFGGCSGLTGIIIPNSVTSIGGGAFSNCTGLTGITIPNSITLISGETFSGCTGLTDITIPGSVTTIGSHAFSGCTGLTDITIPSSVTSISWEVFSGCTGLTSVNIPSSVTSVDSDAFKDCINLTAINVDVSNNKYKSIDGVLFTKDGKTIHSYPGGKKGFYSIPSSVVSISNSTFYGCTGLTGVKIPNGITSISKEAFCNCTGLTSVKIPNSVTYIAYYAFRGCTGLASLIIPSSVAVIDSYAFGRMSSSVKVYCVEESVADNPGLYPGSVTLVYVDPAEFIYNFDSSTGTITGYEGVGGDIIIPSTLYGGTVKKISRYAFDECTTGTSIAIPDSVTSVDYGAFTDCKSLTAVKVGTNNNYYKSVNGVLFTKDGRSLHSYPVGKRDTSYSIPSGVTAICNDAFSGCTGLTGITIPGSVTSIGSNAFKTISSSAKIYCVKGSKADNASLYPAGATILYTNTYLIEYNLNGGSGTIANQTKKYGEAVKISSTVPTRDGYKFMGWSTSAGGSVAYSAGANYSANADLKLYAVWEENVQQTIPSVKILAATNITAKSATLNATIESDGNAAITIRKFAYYEKNNMGAKYEVPANESFTANINNLKPDTEYMIYAYAGNSVGSGGSPTISFKTRSMENEEPVSIEIIPSTQNLRVGAKVKLTTRILPAGAKNKDIVWSSSDESKVTVDANGLITAIKATNTPVIITARTVVNRFEATCNVTVSDVKVALDFSEWHMYSNTRSAAKNGNDVDFTVGGKIQFATAYLTRWNGPVPEREDPYPTGNGSTDLKELSARYHSQDILFIPNRTSDLDNANIKNAIMKYGGVASAMKYNVNCYNFQNASHYLPDDRWGSLDHQVVIVGWDDDYSRDKFINKPAGNGAFICKNSWGTGYGDNGYFYVSYYDKYIGRKGSIGNAVYLPTESQNNYNRKYEHDPLGPAAAYPRDGNKTSLLERKTSGYIANVFPGGNAKLPGNETLSAVSFYTYYMGTSYDIYVVKDFKDATSLERLSSPVESGIQEYAGYHTVKIPPVELKAGSKFAVVVKLSKPGKNFKTYVEAPENYFGKAKANSGESYYSASGSDWKDLTAEVENANFCIKAFTKTKDGVYSPRIVEDSGEQKVNESEKVYTVNEAMALGLEFSEEYVNYVNGLKLFAEADNGVEVIPESIAIGEADEDYLEGTNYSPKYDLRNHGYVSPVKDQGTYLSCWAFAAMGSLESTTLMKMYNNADSSGLEGASDDELLNDVSVKGISFKDMSLIMPAGETKQLSYSITPFNATNKNVVWESSNSNIVSVDTGGNILAKAIGSASITATTVDGSKVAQCTVSVMAGEHVASVQLDEAISCKVGKVMLLDYVISPSNASNKNVSWVSENPQVAQVDENGKLTAVAPGVANITVTTQDGNKTAVCEVTVDDNFDCTLKETSNTISPHGDYMFGTVSAEINNKKSDTLNGTLIFVAYAKDGSVIYSKTKDLSLSSGVSQVSVSDIVISSGTEADSYKLMLWYKGESMKPMANCYEGRFN